MGSESAPSPHRTIDAEELDRDEVVVRIAATPLRPDDGAQLAAHVLDAVRERDGAVWERN